MTASKADLWARIGLRWFLKIQMYLYTDLNTDLCKDKATDQDKSKDKDTDNL